MATIGYEISNYHKSNGTRQIRFRVNHNKTLKYFCSGIFVAEKEISRNGNIKNKVIVSQICEQVAAYTNILTLYKDEVSMCADAQGVYNLIRRIETKSSRRDVDFFEYANLMVARIQAEGRASTAGTYITMLNSFRAYTKCGTLYFNDITSQMLNDYLKQLGLTRRIASLNYTLIKAIFNDAIRNYNIDEIVIRNPFNNVVKPQTTMPEKRGLTAAQIKSIAEVNCRTSREQLAKDVFLLSFFLVGMNVADLYDCDTINDDTITYYRCKTRDRREDKAKMVITIPTIAKDIANRYKDLTRKKVFNFHIRYASSANLTHALNKALKSIGEKVGIPKLQMYCARHSWATIAATDCKIDIYTIHKALNHSSSKLKITETYIRESWDWLQEANNQVIDFVFGT